MLLTAMDREDTAQKPTRRRSGYTPPAASYRYLLADLLTRFGRGPLADRQFNFLREASPDREATIFYAGELDLLEGPTVSIVGTREVSSEGWKRASQLARDLSRAQVTVVSGLAKGVDTAALQSTLAHGGRAVAVIGTPLDKAYPAENADLQRRIYERHLLISPFKEGERVFRSNFPVRNRVMAAISDATVIVEASDTSGTLHQASECIRLNRWLFIMRAVADDKTLSWPRQFLKHQNVAVLSSTDEILSAIGA